MRGRPARGNWPRSASTLVSARRHNCPARPRREETGALFRARPWALGHHLGPIVLAWRSGKAAQFGCEAFTAECLDLLVQFPCLHRAAEDGGVQFCLDPAKTSQDGVDAP